MASAHEHAAWVRVCHESGCTVLGLRGDIDLTATHSLLPVIDVATARPSGPVVLDLTKVVFIDCAGLTLLLHAHRRMRERGRSLLLVVPQRSIRRLIELSGLSPRLPSPVRTLAEALRCAALEDADGDGRRRRPPQRAGRVEPEPFERPFLPVSRRAADAGRAGRKAGR